MNIFIKLILLLTTLSLTSSHIYLLDGRYNENIRNIPDAIYYKTYVRNNKLNIVKPSSNVSSILRLR